ncbi:hypothetical protein [Rhodococcus spongiicola]|nr:hypothetical protein [Rhodococcus spongiicola]
MTGSAPFDDLAAKARRVHEAVAPTPTAQLAPRRGKRHRHFVTS